MGLGSTVPGSGFRAQEFMRVQGLSLLSMIGAFAPNIWANILRVREVYLRF